MQPTLDRLVCRLAGNSPASGWAPDLVIIDEAHRAKNRDAKRTKAIQRLGDATRLLLLLTGTRICNHVQEAAVLLSLLNHRARSHIGTLAGVERKAIDRRD